MTKSDTDQIEAALTLVAQAVADRLKEIEARVDALEKSNRTSLAQRLRDKR